MATDRFIGVTASLAIKVRCVLGAITNVPSLTGISNPYDGVFVVDGDRVLLTAQTDPIENGVWNVNATGPWTRAADWDGNRDVELGSTVWAGQQVGNDILWQVTAPAGVIQPGTTAQTLTLLFNPNAPSSASLADVTLIGSDTLGNPITISQIDPILSLKDSNSLFSTATGRIQWLDSGDAEVARVEVTQTELRLSTINGGIEIFPSGGNPVTLGYSMQLIEESAVIAPAAGFGRLWLRDDSPNVLVFTDDVGGETVLGGGGGVGAVGSIKYTYSGSAGGNPGADSFRTSTGNLTITTAFYFSDTDVDSLDVQNILSTIPIGAHFVIRKVDDSSQFRIYAITNIIDNAGWYQFSCDYLFGNGDTTALTVSDEITIEFFTSAYVEPGAEVASQSDILYWESAEARWEASGTLIRINPNSPPLGGRLQLGTTSGYSTASPQIMRPLGAADTVMDFIYATDPNNGFLQGYRRVAGEMSFGARIASVNTDMLTLDLSSRVRIQPAAAFMIGEKAAAAADLAAYGQLWVRNDAPNVLVYTNDVGTDFVLNAGGAPVPPIVLLDNEQVQYGTGTDVTVDFDGTNFRTIGPAALWLVTGFDQVRFDASIGQNEAAAPDGNVAGVGQWWVRSSAPCRPEFRDDTDVNQLLDPSISEIVSVVASRNLVLTDKGKTIGFTGATAAQTMTIPADGSVAYQIGTFLGFDNSGSVSHSIAITTDTLIFADDNSVGTRTLAAGGAAVAQKVGATTWKIAGAGLT